VSRARPSRPSATAVVRALRLYEAMRVDGEPPPEKETADGPDQTETAVDAAPENDLTTTERQLAREAFAQAKRAFSDAVAGCLAGNPHAEVECADALAALNRARAELQRLGDER